MATEAQAGAAAGGFTVEGKPVTVVRYEVKGKRITSEDLARMERPAADKFENKTAEYYRWYDNNGKERERPLDLEELMAYLQKERLFTKEESALFTETISQARAGDRALWDHLINEKRNPSPLGREAMIEKIDLVMRDGSAIVASRDALSSVEAEGILGAANAKQIQQQVAAALASDYDRLEELRKERADWCSKDNPNGYSEDVMRASWAATHRIEADELTELEDAANHKVVKGRLEGEMLHARETITQETRERQAAANIEQRNMDYEHAYLDAKKDALDRLPEGDSTAKLAELRKRDVHPYSEEQVAEWVAADLQDASYLFVTASDRFEDAALVMASSAETVKGYRERLVEIAPDMAKIIADVERENNIKIEAKEIAKSWDVVELRIEGWELENAVVRGGEQDQAMVVYNAVAVMSDGSAKEFSFEAEEGISPDELHAEAQKAWREQARQIAAVEVQKRMQQQEQAQRMTRLNNEAVAREEAEVDEEQEQPGAMDPNAVPERIAKRFLHVDGKYYFPDEKLAFTDMNNKLRAHEEHHEIVNALVDIAKSRGWESITVRGSEEFRKQVWMRASVQGMEVAGYKPTEVDKAKLAAELEKLGRSPAKDKAAATVNEIEKGIVKEKAQVPPAEQKTAKVIPLRRHDGELVEHGKAPYQNDPKEKENYFVNLRDDKGEIKTIWGVDLERAIQESGAQPGEKVSLKFMGKQQVEVMVNERDEKGNVIGQHPELKDRNTWNVERAEAFRTKSPEDVVKTHPDLAPAYGTMAAAQKFAEQNFKPNDRARFLQGVKEEVASRIEQGQPVPAPRIRSREQEQGQAQEQNRAVAERGGKRIRVADEEMER